MAPILHWREQYTLAVTYKSLSARERANVRRQIKKHWQFTYLTLGEANFPALQISQMKGVAKVEVFRMLLTGAFVDGKAISTEG